MSPSWRNSERMDLGTGRAGRPCAVVSWAEILATHHNSQAVRSP